jgi:ParB-like chromosome segregation protein Spo0J
MNDVSKPAVVAEPTYDYTQHPLSKRFPPYEEEQFDGLVRNIAKIGIRELPIWLFEGDQVLEGWHRYQAGKEAGYKFRPADFKAFTGSYDEAKAFVDAKNAHRRHLTTAQKQEWIKTLLKENPSASDRQIAKLAGVNHRTVANVKESLRDPSDKKLKKFKEDWDGLDDKLKREFIRAYREQIRDLSR